jgi:K+-sensing histidine kinase KdpD
VDNAGVDTAATAVRTEPRNQRVGRRGWLGAAVGLAGLAGITVALLPLRENLSLADVTLLYLVPVVAAAVAAGLGLAVVRGFTEAMDGTLSPSDTPGGGLTMTIKILVAS